MEFQAVNIVGKLKNYCIFPELCYTVIDKYLLFVVRHDIRTITGMFVPRRKAEDFFLREGGTNEENRSTLKNLKGLQKLFP